MKKIKLFDWLLTIFAIIQGSAQLVGVFVPENTVATSSLLKIWISIGDTISDNWLAFSITLVLTALGYFLYRLIYCTPQADKDEEKRRAIVTSFLVIINLALCNKIYSTQSLSEKLIFFKSHIAIIIIAILIILPIIAATLFFKNERKITEKLSKINSKSEPMRSADGINGQNNAVDEYNLASFRMQHPISYAMRSMASYRGYKAKLKYDKDMNKIQLKMKLEKERFAKKIDKLNQDGKEKESPKVTQILAIAFSTVSSLTVTVALTCLLLKEGTLFEFLANPELLMEKLLNFERSSSVIYQLLFRLAIVFSLVIVCFVIYLIVYIVIRIAIYMIFKAGEDESILIRCSKTIKVFVFKSFDSAMRLLLFIPDFIEEVESVLLDTDIDEKIQELYPSNDNNKNKS